MIWYVLAVFYTVLCGWCTKKQDDAWFSGILVSALAFMLCMMWWHLDGWGSWVCGGLGLLLYLGTFGVILDSFDKTKTSNASTSTTPASRATLSVSEPDFDDHYFFSYTKPNGETNTRSVTDVRILVSDRGDDLLNCWDTDANATRSFRLDRIDGTITSETTGEVWLVDDFAEHLGKKKLQRRRRSRRRAEAV